ncbi:hypothetical protein SSP24_62340 [Streptomyces spinoverrucosus]|uniref:Uncharacterized protein n=1 Tax=Streptomyces spinoverrucosus TaxID=284043 RepID=A0A4Y3VSC7_9ACTN|nr:hypothetical protein SSP24_62340 [Streptomyces spinoverrucosus]GHB69066.1 hypothetical protein GCM10010397_44280 [Streptomyces spinoverrucosus]
MTAETDVSARSKPGWNLGSLGVRAAIAAMCPPAEVPAAYISVESAPYSWPCPRIHAITLL